MTAQIRLRKLIDLCVNAYQASWLLKRLSHRTVALVGVVGMAVSQFLCGFTTRNIAGLIFLQGIVFGISGAIVFLVGAPA